ncbi:MAG: hypothetical protein DMG30_24795 [Acidobacteria bacterium]|nr:MAG: hypothetical protein DMG30_24795 [Acidobacteriota bacterium]
MASPSEQDWLSENHRGHFVAQILETLDLSEIEACYERNDGRGSSSALLMRLLLYPGLRSAKAHESRRSGIRLSD